MPGANTAAAEPAAPWTRRSPTRASSEGARPAAAETRP